MPRRSLRATYGSDVMGIVAKLLRSERIKKGLDLDQIAQRTGFSKTYLSPAESGTGNITVGILETYERVLGLDEGYFLDAALSQAEIQRANHRAIPATPMPEEQLEADSLIEVDSLTIIKLRRLALQARKRIWIMDNWIGNDVEDFFHAIHDVFNRSDELRVEVVITDPLHGGGGRRMRDLELGAIEAKRPAILMDQTIHALHKMMEWPHQERINVRFHRLLPSCQFYLFDEVGYVGFHLHRHASREAVQIVTRFPFDSLPETPLAYHVYTEFLFLQNGVQQGDDISRSFADWYNAREEEWKELLEERTGPMGDPEI
jgi:transcriptional regulator with XRE-family HTH domain